MKRKPILFFAAAALCILSACGANEPDAVRVLSTEPAVSASAVPTPVPSPTPAPVEVYGVSVRWDDTEIDLHDAPVSDAGAALTEALSALPQVRRVDMTGCGLSN